MVSFLFWAGNKPTHCLQGDPISILQADTRCADMQETPRELPSNNTLVNREEWQWGGVLLHKEETGSKTRKKTDPRGTKRSTTHSNLGYHPNCRYMKSLSGSPVNFVLYLLGVPDIVFAPEWTVLMPSSGSYFHLGTCSLKPTRLKKTLSLEGKNIIVGPPLCMDYEWWRPWIPVSNVLATFSLSL